MRFKLLLNLLSFFIAIQAFSQSWCYPGATWYFTHYSPSASLYTRLNYVKDTLILSKNCNKITYFTQGFGMFGPVSGYGANLYTYVNGNVVYIKDVTGTTSNFDTLFNYGATVGDSWYMAPKSVTNCANSKITVVDTGHAIIQSQYLKWLKVNVNGYSYSSSTFFTDTLFERIGCVLKYFYHYQDVCATTVDSELGGPLRCYSDNQIINYKRYAGVCNYYYSMGVEENESEKGFILYPNPSSAQLNIRINGASAFSGIEIHNSLGQKMLSCSFSDQVDISFLNEGVYLIKFTNPGKPEFYQKFIVKK